MYVNTLIHIKNKMKKTKKSKKSKNKEKIGCQRMCSFSYEILFILFIYLQNQNPCTVQLSSFSSS